MRSGGADGELVAWHSQCYCTTCNAPSRRGARFNNVANVNSARRINWILPSARREYWHRVTFFIIAHNRQSAAGVILRCIVWKAAMLQALSTNAPALLHYLDIQNIGLQLMQRMTSFLPQMYINCISANVRNAKSACSKCPPYAGFKYHGAIRNESVPKIIINNIVNYFFLNCNQHFGNFKP